MTREEALVIAEGLVVADIATPEEIAEAIFNAWSDGYAQGDKDGNDAGWQAALDSYMP